ncbi:hypothetical protein SRB17_88520 [Streptomyces sp. RB17]|nr:hypothetical protein [Streptomyces sp. RB17]
MTRFRSCVMPHAVVPKSGPPPRADWYGWNVMTSEDNGDSEAPHVGVRLCVDVETLLDDLTSGHGAGSPQFQAGEVAAFEWALGRSESSPVTGRGVPCAPDLAVLTAELDAATVQLENPSGSPGSSDYLRGIHAALNWVCGYDTGLL